MKTSHSKERGSCQLIFLDLNERSLSADLSEAESPVQGLHFHYFVS